MAAGF
jgi:hypothetical protein